MFNLTKTFQNKTFSITPIMMGDTVIFLPSELSDQLGYEDLAHSIRNSENTIENVDYLVVDRDNLRQLKELVREIRSTAFAPIAPNLNSLIVLTESGLWWTMINSRKPECVKLRIWITSEVIPAIRKTGTYIPENAPILLQIEQCIGELMDQRIKLATNISRQTAKVAGIDNKLERLRGTIVQPQIEATQVNHVRNYMLSLLGQLRSDSLFTREQLMLGVTAAELYQDFLLYIKQLQEFVTVTLIKFCKMLPKIKDKCIHTRKIHNGYIYTFEPTTPLIVAKG